MPTPDEKAIAADLAAVTYLLEQTIMAQMDRKEFADFASVTRGRLLAKSSDESDPAEQQNYPEVTVEAVATILERIEARFDEQHVP